MNSVSGRFGFLIGTSLLACLAAAPAASETGGAGQPGPQAQDPSAPVTTPSAGTSETDILVVARRRTEALQDVPAAITAFTNDTIEAAGIERPIEVSWSG